MQEYPMFAAAGNAPMVNHARPPLLSAPHLTDGNELYRVRQIENAAITWRKLLYFHGTLFCFRQGTVYNLHRRDDISDVGR